MSERTAATLPIAAQPIAVNDNDARAANDNLRVANEPSHKRRKSLGEHLFNATTYAGVTWIGNEVLSTGIWGWVEKQGSLANKVYQGGLKHLPEWGSKPFRILWLTIGGSMLVPLVKLLEDNKGKLVRHADARLEGKKAHDDPALEQAHHDMDVAPKQSWGSLWKGRGVVMALAIALDYFCGGENAPTRKWFDGTPFTKYSTMERASATITRDALSAKFSPLKWLERDSTKREAIASARHAALPKGASFGAIDAAKEGKAAGLLGGTFGFVLVLSGILSAIFYVSSKFFAAKREEKHQRDETIHELERAGVIPPKQHFLDKETAPATDSAPSTTISNATHDSALLQRAEPAHAPA